MIKPILNAFSLPMFARTIRKIGIVTRLSVFLLLPFFSFSQTFHGFTSAPANDGAQAGPTVAIAGPANMLAGDLVVIYGQYRVASIPVTMNALGGQTWNTAVNSYTPGSNQTVSVFWCRYNGAWAGSPSVTVGTGNTSGLSAFMYVFRPSNSSSLWAINNAATNNTSAATTNSITGITPTASNTVTMAFWSVAAANTWGTLSGTGTGWSKTGLGAYYRNTTSAQSHTAAYNLQTTTNNASGNVSQIQSAGTTALRSIMSWYEYPPNDNSANATLITTAPTCVGGTSSFTNQTLNGASADGGGITSGCTSTNNPDVWYKFIAQTKYPVITVNNLGASWSTRLKIQLLSTTPGPFTEISCFNNSLPATSIPIMPSGTGLTVGTTYYVRIQKNNGGTPTGGSAAWSFDICVTDPAGSMSGRMNEVFKQTILSGPTLLADPWEITYGPDDNLWITESKGYKVYKMDPVSGLKQTVLDISQNSTFLPAADQVFNCQFGNGNGVQGGLAGLALHPKFLATSGAVNYAYVSYVYKFDSSSVFNSSCTFWKTRLVRFTYNPTSQKFESPVSLCDTLPGGNDHNSQRMIIAPVNGIDYLFYAQGDLGGGQLSCRLRVQNAQNINSYEGKILRFNLDTDHDSPTLSALSNWIPNGNPYNILLAKQSAVWATGIRNNQGFAYDKERNILYGSSHGPYSDDEINIIEPFTNYGHPIVIGYASDGNYNGNSVAGTTTSVSAGSPYTDNNGVSLNPAIGDEMANKAAINAAGKGLYKDPLFSAYAAPNGDLNTPGTIKYIWRNNPNNATPAPGWPSEAWSGLDIYTHTLIPGWKKSLIASSLKWGRLVRIKLDTSGTITLPSKHPVNNAGDTISYFGSQNRFRDIAIAPNGKDIYVIMDRSTTTSGPSAQFPVIPSCAGCVQKYTFLGYTDNGGKSSIPESIDVTRASFNTPHQGTTVTIDASNNNIWVPITGPDGNIMAEINAMGQNLGEITSAFYQHKGSTRQKNGFRYLNRNITITPAVTTFSIPVKVRLYIAKAEFDSLDADPASTITGIAQLKILKNEDPLGPAIVSSTTEIPAAYTDISSLTHGDSAYVLQGTVDHFSSFFFGASNMTLPLELVYFKGALQNNATLLQWQTDNETNTSHFGVERSLDGRAYTGIGSVTSIGNGANKYSYTDYDVNSLSATVIYYRLKMIDADGQFKYSNVVAVYLADITGLTVSPNPTSGDTKMLINATSNGTIRWELRDNNGKIMMQNAADVFKGKNNITINVSRLSLGIYYLHVTGAGIDKHVKLQKL